MLTQEVSGETPSVVLEEEGLALFVPWDGKHTSAHTR